MFGCAATLVVHGSLNGWAQRDSDQTTTPRKAKQAPPREVVDEADVADRPRVKPERGEIPPTPPGKHRVIRGSGGLQPPENLGRSPAGAARPTDSEGGRPSKGAASRSRRRTAEVTPLPTLRSLQPPPTPNRLTGRTGDAVPRPAQVTTDHGSRSDRQPATGGAGSVSRSKGQPSPSGSRSEGRVPTGGRSRGDLPAPTAVVSRSTTSFFVTALPTRMSVTNGTGSDADVKAVFRPSDGSYAAPVSVRVPARRTLHWSDAIAQLFGLAESPGSLVFEGADTAKLTITMQAGPSPSPRAGSIGF